VTFEHGSKLATIESGAFHSCRSLQFLRIPARVAKIAGAALSTEGAGHLSVEEGNSFFKTCGPFLTDFAGASLNQYFGRDQTVKVPKSIEVLGEYCFGWCADLRVVTFERETRISIIPFCAFCGCRSLVSICIPSTVTDIEAHAFDGCHSLSDVCFEVDSKLLRISNAAFPAWAFHLNIRIPSAVVARCAASFGHCKRRAIVTSESVQFSVIEWVNPVPVIHLVDFAENGMFFRLAGARLQNGFKES
jgi:hypothetical protein